MVKMHAVLSAETICKSEFSTVRLSFNASQAVSNLHSTNTSRFAPSKQLNDAIPVYVTNSTHNSVMQPKYLIVRST